MMSRMQMVAMVAVVAVLVVASEAYMKAWEDGEPVPERSSPYEQAMQRLQTYLDSADQRQQRFPDADLPAKRQMRYNQCYFNPISCFRRRK